MCGLEDETAVGTDPSVWTFTPGRAGPVTLRTATINVVSSDGGTVHNRNRFGNAGRLLRSAGARTATRR